ncbi:MAG: glutamine--tRNA ligase/YqeY domain fusion protein [Bacteroidia bacterium]|nr:glutamine--tRNA ligase/YqeY domain fusion protein [Bacteroidia bacterium]
MSTKETTASKNFIEHIVEEDLRNAGDGYTVYTRFPPEPNGYLHIGHAKSIVLNFTLAQQFGGKTNLRFDDTNPTKESTEFVEAIERDIKWLGFDWEGEVRYASDYYKQLYDWAVELIKKGKAYVDDSSVEEMREMRGVPTSPGQESPYRSRSVEENLDLLEKMKDGEFDEGSRVLRAKIDMASPNMHMRDPIMYRILKTPHHRTGTNWNIYPMYDWAHGQSDALEGITHSICTLEFEVHRPLYNWFLDQLSDFKPRPQQIEFARLNLSYTITSKSKLSRLVEENFVSGWDDPRMPTISGMRRRGYTALAIKNFATGVGIARRENVIDLSLLEFYVREDLNKVASRVMGVLNPVKLIITNYPEDQVEEMEIENNPEDPNGGVRKVPFSRELWIERDDFKENPPSPKKWYRLGPERKARLKGAYIIEGTGFKKNEETGEIEEIYATYFPESRSGNDTSGIKVKGTMHWVSAQHALKVEVRQYDRLFLDPDPAGHKEKDYLEFLNPESLKIIEEAYVEPSLKEASSEDHFQFIRKGYYIKDEEASADKLVFNQTVTLRDNWAKKNS